MADRATRYVCARCGSSDVLRDAWAKQDEETGEWELSTVFDAAYCNVCGGETSLVERKGGEA